MQKEEEIITFETYYDPMLAQIIRTKLEANGIPCFVTDESLGILYPVYNQGGGGIKIKVFARDLEKCRELIAEDSELPPDFETPHGADNVVICPYCGSTNVLHVPPAENKTSWLDDVVSVIEAINPFHNEKAWHCNNCRQDFE
ncbi:MAG: hypothetical protein JWP37_3827 [Mucilaginibacter sp.]|nr:hypothetical protein [Mucilaginibacter sp.]